MRPQVTFFFPYHDVSGVPVLFSRLARHLASQGRAIRVIDYPDGYQSRVLRGTAGIELVAFADGQPMHVGDTEQLIMQSILPATIRPELIPSRETKLFFWTLHPLNFVQTLLPVAWARDFQTRHPDWNRRMLNLVLRRHRVDLAAVVSKMHNAGALAFMDGNTLDSTTIRLGVQLSNPLFLPVPVDTPKRCRTRRISPRGTLSVAWVGRLADFKVHILAYTLSRLSRWAGTAGVDVTMHVVGDGPESHVITSLSVDHERFHLRMLGEVSGDELDRFLEARIDVMVAMGTSALEGARLGIPVILADIAYAPIKGDYNYRWLFQSDRYSVGDVIGRQHFLPGNLSLENMFESLSDNYQFLSNSTYEYCVNTHSLESVASKFVKAADASNFKWHQLSNEVLRKSAVRQLFEWWRNRTRQGTPAL